jgi:Protein of unknown function (DUF3175)
MAKARSKRKWIRQVRTDSTVPPPLTFAGSAEHIAHTMARKHVSPKGLGSGIRMIQFFINRAGKNLPATRRRELERAKRILQRRATRQKARARRVDGEGPKESRS